MTKPPKEPYTNQEEIHNQIVSFLESQLKGTNCEAYIFGSLATRKFGRYTRPYKGQDGSDVDLVVFINQKDIPETWIDLNTEKTWWRAYESGKITVNNTQHVIIPIVVKPGMENYARNRMRELNWTIEKVF